MGARSAPRTTNHSSCKPGMVDNEGTDGVGGFLMMMMRLFVFRDINSTCFSYDASLSAMTNHPKKTYHHFFH